MRKRVEQVLGERLGILGGSREGKERESRSMIMIKH